MVAGLSALRSLWDRIPSGKRHNTQVEEHTRRVEGATVRLVVWGSSSRGVWIEIPGRRLRNMYRGRAMDRGTSRRQSAQVCPVCPRALIRPCQNVIAPINTALSAPLHLQGWLWLLSKTWAGRSRPVKTTGCWSRYASRNKVATCPVWSSAASRSTAPNCNTICGRSQRCNTAHGVRRNSTDSVRAARGMCG